MPAMENKNAVLETRTSIAGVATCDARECQRCLTSVARQNSENQRRTLELTQQRLDTEPRSWLYQPLTHGHGIAAESGSRGKGPCVQPAPLLIESAVARFPWRQVD